MKHYFKYKRLNGDSFKYFVKMLVESRIYASSFKKLNDPMEGAFLSSNANNSLIDEIRNEKDAIKIISLIEKHGDEKPCNMLMWSHYTDEHQGCCIEFHFQDEKEDNNVSPVKYVRRIDDNTNENGKVILLRKFIDWKYEQEVRHLGSEELVPIEIDRIYLGMRIDDMYGHNNSEEVFFRELIKRINSKIEVVKMRAEDFDGHHIDTLRD